MVIGCYETSDGYQLSGCGQGVDGECSGQLTQLLARFIYCRVAHMLSLEPLSKDNEDISLIRYLFFPKALSAVQLVSK